MMLYYYNMMISGAENNVKKVVEILSTDVTINTHLHDVQILDDGEYSNSSFYCLIEFDSDTAIVKSLRVILEKLSNDYHVEIEVYSDDNESCLEHLYINQKIVRELVLPYHKIDITIAENDTFDKFVKNNETFIEHLDLYGLTIDKLENEYYTQSIKFY